MYPTGPKLISGLLFAALAWLVADLVKPLLPPEVQTTLLSPVSATVGFLMAWRLVGRRSGGGFGTAAAMGLTAVGATVFWSLLIWAGREMLRRSLRLYYDDPVVALEDMVSLMIHYARFLGDPGVLGTAAIGAVFCAWVTEFMARRTA